MEGHVNYLLVLVVFSVLVVSTSSYDRERMRGNPRDLRANTKRLRQGRNAGWHRSVTGRRRRRWWWSLLVRRGGGQNMACRVSGCRPFVYLIVSKKGNVFLSKASSRCIGG